MLIAQLPPDSQAATASQFTESACAVPVANIRGAALSAPAMAAIPNVLRIFFNVDPLAKRAPKNTSATNADAACLSARRRSWGVPSRSGTTVGDKSVSCRMTHPTTSERSAPRIGPLTRRCLDMKLFAPAELKMNVQKSEDEVTSVSNVSRSDHRMITAAGNP